MAQHAEDGGPGLAAATLGSVLYPENSKSPVPEAEWVRLVRATAAGDQLALHALYDRAHRLVFTLAMRITGSRENAEEVTLDVFHDVWRRAGGYDPANGTVIGWIMNQGRSRAIDRRRFDQRRKRVDPDNGLPAAEQVIEALDLVQLNQRREILLRALSRLSLGERQAIESAFFSELTHAEVAVRLHEPLGTVKTRIRSGLQKLRQALSVEGSLR